MCNYSFIAMNVFYKSIYIEIIQVFDNHLWVVMAMYT